MNAWVEILCATECADEDMACAILAEFSPGAFPDVNGVSGDVFDTDPRVGERISDRLADAGVCATVFTVIEDEDG